MERIAIIADDLTGANDTGVQFCQHGFRTLVIIDADTIGQVGGEKEVLAINTDTRHLTAKEAYQRVYDIALKLKATGISRIYKKIDSTLRGHPGAELEAVMDAWPADLALLVPAFPANRRVVQQGYLIINENTGAAVTSEDNGITVGESASCHVPTILQQEMQRRVGQVDLATVRRGAAALITALEAAQKTSQVLVLDAASEDDLQIIARAIGQLPRSVVVAGAAGLAAHLNLAWDLKPAPPFSLRQEGVVLLVAGSRNPVTARQVQRLATFSSCQPVLVNTAAILAGAAREEVERVLQEAGKLAAGKGPLMITVASMFQGKPACRESVPAATGNENSNHGNGGKAIAAALGTITARLLAMYKVKGLVVTGGDTAVHVCRSLSARGISLATELLPGIPLGYLEGGPAAGLPIVTKAGGFGPPEAFIKVFQYLSRTENQNP
ncbi:D-threonate kinase [Neomoorella glycerini]|uniref:D-threonate kinase n=1 Tax=Neomoorella glycerini TaxID=55779 RepID=A0A6I5ZTA3_9FIRM|nr:four-carbon acid sugar kinase family protein [Moorella glycerini]QGP92767.1 D-threonate kinase [Moorella glycerini]